MRVFLSSTIYDFRDLRSALRLWLEEHGYEVLLSELNDFPQVPDQNSYSSCLRTIDNCDYFILLVGHRSGGWVDRAARLSITRAEYRYAYDRARLGKLKLMTFVRKDVWDVREDRRALRDALRNAHVADRELSEAEQAALLNHPSKFVNDAEYTFEFLREVGRVDEMRLAIDGGGELPPGNWIYQFSSFREIIDAARTVLDLTGSLRRKSIRANLMHELEGMTSHLLRRTRGSVAPITSLSSLARRRVVGGFGDSSVFTGQQMMQLGMFAMFHGNVGARIKTAALQDAVQSGEFLEFDKASDRHVVGSLQRSLFDLHSEVDRLTASTVAEVFKTGMEILRNERYRNHRESEHQVSNDEVVVIFAVHDNIDNVIALARAIYGALRTGDSSVEDVQLNATSPFEREAESIERDTVTRDEARAWLAQG